MNSVVHYKFLYTTKQTALTFTPGISRSQVGASTIPNSSCLWFCALLLMLFILRLFVLFFPQLSVNNHSTNEHRKEAKKPFKHRKHVLINVLIFRLALNSSNSLNFHFVIRCLSFIVCLMLPKLSCVRYYWKHSLRGDTNFSVTESPG